jgi:hypothetical protein
MAANDLRETKEESKDFFALFMAVDMPLAFVSTAFLAFLMSDENWA